ncbi:MAG: hypothetical protein ABJB40_11015 [Acidobacteriota bacterium]
MLEIRCEMALEAHYDVDLFAELARSGKRVANSKRRPLETPQVNPPSKIGVTRKPVRTRGK